MLHCIDTTAQLSIVLLIGIISPVVTVIALILLTSFIAMTCWIRRHSKGKGIYMCMWRKLFTDIMINFLSYTSCTRCDRHSKQSRIWNAATQNQKNWSVWQLCIRCCTIAQQNFFLKCIIHCIYDLRTFCLYIIIIMTLLTPLKLLIREFYWNLNMCTL